MSQKLYRARVPTNIALIKYWGKSDEALQWPANDSLSMTLDLYTETIATIRNEDSLSNSPLVLSAKAQKHLDFLQTSLGFQETLSLQTKNEFPPGCGIASSASGLGALTLAAIACWTRSESLSELSAKGFPLERLAALARRGSGSACRSFWGGFVEWRRGTHPSLQTTEVLGDADHWALRDCIVILSDAEKTVSSSDGHRLALTSPLFEQRLQSLPEHTRNLKAALLARDLPELGFWLEAESDNMHSIMASSKPPCVYMSSQTRDFISTLKVLRQIKGLDCYYTVDAGPNVHVVYQAKDQGRIKGLLDGFRTIDVGISRGPHLDLAQD